jgi:ABC-type antimicrobial peptide transport system permease subunit
MHFNTQYDGAISIRHLWTLGAIGLLLVLTACVNFINLSTAHALKRAKEIGVRKVLGGMKSQLYWQFIAETALITAIGIVLAVGLSSQMLPLINDFFTTRMTLDLFSDPYLGPFIVGLGVAVTFLAGSYPGFVLARFQPVVALKGSLSQQHIGGFKTRRALIVGQFIVSQILVIGVVVIMSQMQYAKNSDWGFERAAIAMVPIGIDSTRLKMKVLKNEIARIAGVEKVSLCTAAPASAGNWGNSIRFDHAPEEVNFRTIMKASDDQYLTLFGVELVAGRNLFPADSVKEFVVNETLVRKLNLPSPETAIGKTITANGGSMVGPIVGVVKDFHDYSFHRDISPMAFMSYTENYAYIAVKMNLHDAKTTLSAIEQVWKRQFPDQIFESRLLDEQLAEFYEAEDRILTMVQFFSFIALFIGCLGLYGLVSFMVAQKTKEIGVRKVLGGNVAQILWLFGKEFLRLILIAIVIASPIAYYFMQRWLADFAYRIDMQWWMFAGAGMAAVLIAFLTVGFQSVKAALANPVKSLRSE